MDKTTKKKMMLRAVDRVASAAEEVANTMKRYRVAKELKGPLERLLTCVRDLDEDARDLLAVPEQVGVE